MEGSQRRPPMNPFRLNGCRSAASFTLPLPAPPTIIGVATAKAIICSAIPSLHQSPAANSGKMKWYSPARPSRLLTGFSIFPAYRNIMNVRLRHKQVPMPPSTSSVSFMPYSSIVKQASLFSGVNETPVTAIQMPGKQSAPWQPIAVKPPPPSSHEFPPWMLTWSLSPIPSGDHRACQTGLRQQWLDNNPDSGPFRILATHEPGAPRNRASPFPRPIVRVRLKQLRGRSTKLRFIFVSMNEYQNVGSIKTSAEIPQCLPLQRPPLRKCVAPAISLGKRSHRNSRKNNVSAEPAGHFIASDIIVGDSSPSFIQRRDRRVSHGSPRSAIRRNYRQG